MTGSKSASPSNCIEFYSAFFLSHSGLHFQGLFPIKIWLQCLALFPNSNMSRNVSPINDGTNRSSSPVLSFLIKFSGFGRRLQSLSDGTKRRKQQFRLEKMGLWGFIVPSFRLAHVHWVDWIAGKIWRPWNIGVSSIFPQVVMLANSDFIPYLPFEY